MKANDNRGAILIWGRLCIIDGEIILSIQSLWGDVISARAILFQGRLYSVTLASAHIYINVSLPTFSVFVCSIIAISNHTQRPISQDQGLKTENKSN